MQDYINGFIPQLKEAIQIGSNADLNSRFKEIKNVLICGLGGSGIGGTVITKTVSDSCKVPVLTCNDYKIPNFVNENTLVIASTYSGNTEETLSAIKFAKNKNAEIAIITSGGEALEIAKSNDYNHIIVPNGNPPRTCIGYSITQLLYLFVHYDLADPQILNELKESISLLELNASSIREEAKTIAPKLVNKIPVIYSSDSYECIAIRFRQQINENSKALAWHHRFPELNHNEIVGWTEKNEKLAVIFLRNEDEFYRTKERIEFTKKLVNQYADSVTEIKSKGSTYLQRAIYMIHLVDWISYEISVIKNIDPIEINIINSLKDHLATID